MLIVPRVEGEPWKPTWGSSDTFPAVLLPTTVIGVIIVTTPNSTRVRTMSPCLWFTTKLLAAFRHLSTWVRNGTVYLVISYCEYSVLKDYLRFSSFFPCSFFPCSCPVTEMGNDFSSETDILKESVYDRVKMEAWRRWRYFYVVRRRSLGRGFKLGWVI